MGGRETQGLRRLWPDGATGVGLLFVYAGIPLLAAVVHHVSSARWAAAGALGVCLVGSVATGVGLCGRERWAWATGLCVCAAAATAGLVVAATAGAALVAHARALSWQPVFHGLASAETRSLAFGALLLCAGALAAVPVLWRRQHEFDVPHRRGYTTLTREGALPAAILIVAAGWAVVLAWPAG